MRGTLLAMMLAACGDPRAGFVGKYSGSATRTAMTSTGPVTSSSVGSFMVTAPPGTDRLQFDNGCMWTAVAESATTIQFDPIACPTSHGTSIDGTAADFTDSISSGTGSLTNKTLTLSLDGRQVGTNYADGRPNMTYDFSESLTATRD